MKKSKSRIWQWLFLVAASAGTVFIVFWLMDSPEGTSNIVISVCSIIVTAILGIVTYKQTATQNRIDMLDKIPYVRLVYENLDEIKDKGTYQDVLLIYNNKKYINLTGCAGRYIIPLKVKNAGTIAFKKITHFYFEGDFCKEQANWVELSDSGRAIIMSDDLDNKNESEQLDFLNQFTYSNADIMPGEEIEIETIVSKPDFKSGGVFTYSFAFEIESIYGYSYTQYIMIKTYLAGLAEDGSVKLQVVDQNVEIEYGKMKRK